MEESAKIPESQDHMPYGLVEAGDESHPSQDRLLNTPFASGVFDGVGSWDFGDTATFIAREEIIKGIAEARRENYFAKNRDDLDRYRIMGTIIETSFKKVFNRIGEYTKSKKMESVDQNGKKKDFKMGTTVSLAVQLLTPEELESEEHKNDTSVKFLLINSGDSRTIHFDDNGEILNKTEINNPFSKEVNDILDNISTHDDFINAINNFPEHKEDIYLGWSNKNILSKTLKNSSVGENFDVPDIAFIDAPKGSFFLSFTDGFDMLAGFEIEQIVKSVRKQNGSSKDVVDALMNKASKRKELVKDKTNLDKYPELYRYNGSDDQAIEIYDVV